MFHSYRNQKSAFSKMPNSVFSEDVKERRWMIIKSIKFSISQCSAKWIYYLCLKHTVLQGWVCHRQIIYPLPLLSFPPSILSSIQTAGVLIRFKVWIHLVAWRNSIPAPVRGMSQSWSFLLTPKDDTLSLGYCIYGKRVQERYGLQVPPPHVRPIIFWGEVCAKRPCVELQSARRVQEVLDRRPRGSCYSQSWLGCLSWVQRGEEDFLWWGVILHL